MSYPVLTPLPPAPNPDVPVTFDTLAYPFTQAQIQLVEEINLLVAQLNATMFPPTPLPISSGGTGSSTAAAARTALGIKAAALEDVVPLTKGGTGATSATAARTALGLGSVATLSTVPVANGGTGATSATAARTALGLGSAAVLDVVTSNTDTTANRLLKTVAGPAQAFRRGNILGTVSQSSGVPTGAIIEEGSVSAGEYVRFADGTQICWGTPTAQAPSGTSGGIANAPAENTWTFPKAFSGSPVVFGSSGSSSTVWVSAAPDTNTRALYRTFRATTATGTYALRLMAIGRWF